ncbi:MAG: VCBS repeat-containing protein [Acidobacteriota bacterium]|nr:VCBS repeat-containing protein [Acidobacteriota bacterium]
MRRLAFLAAALSLAAAADGLASVQFIEHAVSKDAPSARSVFAADVDSDGDIDLLSASEGDDTIAWYESDGSSPPVFTERIISTNADAASCVFAADLDGDGDVDVLSTSVVDDKVAWYESDGRTPPSFTERVITSTADGAVSVFAIDVNGDGATDIVTAAGSDNEVAWHENDGGSPPVFIERIISTEAELVSSIFATDVDGDSDIDVLSASWLDDKIAWYENLGGDPPGFVERVISTSADAATAVFATDLDSDGDTDVLSASFLDNRIAWYENQGNPQPTFLERTISTTAELAESVFAADVDGDGHVDVLSASLLDDTIAWYENDGSSPPGFIERIIRDDVDLPEWVVAADMDGDGDTDVVSAARVDTEVAWYENVGPDVIFSDGFESGDTSAWSSTVP